MKKITSCKLSKKLQPKLLEHFARQVTARAAADILGLYPDRTALFYKKFA